MMTEIRWVVVDNGSYDFFERFIKETEVKKRGKSKVGG